MGKTTDIRAAVEAELTFDPRVDDADVHVANMNGDVALNGTVPSYPQYLEAAAAGGSGSPEHGRRGRIPGPAEALRSDPWVWWCNSGPDVDPGQAGACLPGGFVHRVARTPHYDGARADAAEPAVIAVSGIAPVRQQWVDASQPVLRQWPGRPGRS